MAFTLFVSYHRPKHHIRYIFMFGDVSRHIVEMVIVRAVKYCVFHLEQLKPVKYIALSISGSMDFVHVRLIPHATLEYWNIVNIAVAGNIHEAVPQRGYESVGLRGSKANYSARHRCDRGIIHVNHLSSGKLSKNGVALDMQVHSLTPPRVSEI